MYGIIYVPRRSLEALGTHIGRAGTGGWATAAGKSRKNPAPGRRQTVVRIPRKAAPGAGLRERQSPFDAPTSWQEAPKE